MTPFRRFNASANDTHSHTHTHTRTHTHTHTHTHTYEERIRSQTAVKHIERSAQTILPATMQRSLTTRQQCVTGHPLTAQEKSSATIHNTQNNTNNNNHSNNKNRGLWGKEQQPRVRECCQDNVRKTIKMCAFVSIQKNIYSRIISVHLIRVYNNGINLVHF